MMFRSLAVLGLAPTFAQAFSATEVELGGDGHSNIATSSITLNKVEYATTYNDILRSGDEVGGVVFGAVLDQNQSTIFAYPMDASYVEIPVGNEPGSDPLISNVPDFTSLINTTGGATEFAMFSHFETPLPASIYRINVDFDESCAVKVDSLEFVDFSAWGGLWEPCSAKVTPWNTHMGSEEHEPDAKILKDYETFMAASEAGDASALNVMLFMRYFGFYSSDITDDASLEKLKTVFNPYKYGHVTELSVDKEGKTQVHKWYTTGRVSIENPAVMPDGKTVYVADDANFGVLTKFVMDTAKDMSSGTLYAAKFTQGAAATAISRAYGDIEWAITWVELGSATQDELVELVDGLTFEKIFTEGDAPKDGVCATGFTYVKAGWGLIKEECLKVVDGMETAAAFFETRRYAALKGATVELQASEGMAVVPDANKFYLSLSAISNGMDETVLPVGDIALAANKCGCVFEFDVDETFSLTTARAFICGQPLDAPDADLNACNTTSIASPDNLYYMGHVANGPNQLLIAEDTSHHRNDYLWAYDFETETMTRLLTSVYGSQITSPAFYEDGKGCYLLMAVVPHPYKKSDQDLVGDGTLGLAGTVGYIGPLGSRSDEL